MNTLAKLIMTASALMPVLSGCRTADMEETPVAIAIPEGVRIDAVGPTSLTFTWKEVEGAETYTFRLDDEDENNVDRKTDNTTSVEYTGLTTGKEYYFKVRANIGDRSSDYCEPVTAIPGVSEEDPPAEDPDEGGEENPDVPDDVYAMFNMPANEENLGALAFPGAEGGGMYVTGGRGGKVIHVTNLNDSGEGSLRAAVEASGTRTVVFDVAGRIKLEKELRIRNGNITIAGQTAPGNGICISGQTVRVDADNVIIRFMRFRLGYDGNKNADGEDTIWGRYHENIILDHCSMSWSIDEVASFYANRNFTMQWCILSEALRNSGHSKGGHGYGGIWGGRNASFHHNLLAHNDSRNARIDHPGIYIQKDGDYRSTHRGNVDYRNNVIYNYGSNSTYGGEDGHFNIVGNYYKSGPASESNGNKVRKYFVDAYWYNKDSDIGSAYPELYLSDNYNTDGIDSKYPDGVYYHSQGDDPEGVILQSPLPIRADDSKICHVSTHPVQKAYACVVDYAGASLVRDKDDIRVTGNVEKGDYSYEGSNGSTGGLIDSQNDVGGWDTYSAEEDVKDTDGDGLPDWFEEQFGVSDPSSVDLDRHGRYTNLEMYLHYLVKDIIAAQNTGAAYTSLD